MSSINPCQFKKVCTTCMKADLDSRPMMCIALSCEHYELCSGCQQNRTLHGDRRLCKNCLGLTSQGVASISSNVASEIKSRTNDGVGRVFTNADGSTKEMRVSVTAPGIPPPEFNDNQKQYYEDRWKQYEGYYRNPAAYFICHMMIIEEINLTYLNSLMILSRGQLNFEHTKERQQSIQMLKILNEQLPERESQDVMDDEKSLSQIYDSYIQEKRARSLSGTSRMLTPAAVALIPELNFNFDAKSILERCGYRLEEIERVLDRVESLPIDRTPEEVLQFFGFKLKEEYAMPYTPDDPENYVDLTEDKE